MTADLILLSSMATRHILNDLLAAIRQNIGVAVSLRAMGGVDAANLVRQGGKADIVLLAAGAMQKLAEEGHILPHSLAPVAASSMAFCMAEGAEPPDLASGEAVRAAMLKLRVGYSTGPSGDHLRALWQRWGITEGMEKSAVQAPPGVPVASLVASGQADIGVQQLSELLGQPGIVSAPLPPDIQLTTVFTGGISAGCAHADAAARVLAYLASADTAPVKALFGMAQP